MTIGLKQAGTGVISVQSVEMSQTITRTRCMFSETSNPADILNPVLLREIEDAFLAHGVDLGVSSYPDYRLTLPGLALTKARVLVTRAGGGDRYIMIRYAVCYGNVAALFSAKAEPWKMGHDQAQLLAAETLERVFMPLMNFADHVTLDIQRIRAGGEDNLADGLDMARQRIDELELYYNMLVEFVAQNREEPERGTLLALESLGGMR
ncbi:MAG: hypothetical protein AAFX00_01115 [Pseudomonadota bacterium]